MAIAFATFPSFLPLPMGIQSFFHKFTKRSSEQLYDTNLSSYGNAATAGWRLMLHTSQAIPETLQVTLGGGQTLDSDGKTPVYIASAHIGRSSVQPCKYVPTGGVLVPYGGEEYKHEGRFDLLLFDPENMEWVPTSHGQVPANCKPVDGGFEEDGLPLYHALWTVNNISVPGKTGRHLRACHAPFGRAEVVVKDGYQILCWKSSSPFASCDSHGSQHAATESDSEIYDPSNS